MADTFGQLWNRVLLYAPGTPVPLAQQFVKDAYRRVIASHLWSELFREGEQTIPTWYSTGTADCAEGDAVVTGSGTTWTSDMVGRQFHITNRGYYTILSVTSATELTLDRVWEGDSVAGSTYEIAQLYVEFPTDFWALDDIRDTTRNWRLRRRYHQQNYLDLVDPRRTSVGAPALYVDAPPRIDPTTGASYPRVEFWPKIAGGTQLLYRYIKKEEFSGLSTQKTLDMIRGEAVEWGALSDLALWPGTDERKNLFFNPELHKTYKDRAEEAIHHSEMADLERQQRLLIISDDSTGLPADARFLQEHGIPF